MHIEAWDCNCPRHIPRKFSEEEVLKMVAPFQARIAELEAQLAAAADYIQLERILICKDSQTTRFNPRKSLATIAIAI